MKGRKVKEAVRRIDIGGKVLTNHLKELISYRQLNVMDESYVINQVKEDACFVSNNFYADMEVARRRAPENNIVREYVLPDFTAIKRGYLREPAAGKSGEDDLQILRLNNERFSIPELLFHPSDVGIQQMGLAEAIIEACRACPEKALGHLLPNIVVIGGCAMFPGMQKRLQKEVRALAPEHLDVSVTVPEKYACHIDRFFNSMLSSLSMFCFCPPFPAQLLMPGSAGNCCLKAPSSAQCV